MAEEKPLSDQEIEEWVGNLSDEEVDKIGLIIGKTPSRSEKPLTQSEIEERVKTWMPKMNERFKKIVFGAEPK